MTCFASVQPRDLQLLHRTAHRIPEINLDLVFKVAAGFLLRLYDSTASAAAAEKLAETDHGSCLPRRLPLRSRKVNPPKSKFTAASSSPPPCGGAAPD